MSINDRLVCFKHVPTGLEFALDGVYVDPDNFYHYFHDPILNKLNNIFEPPALEVMKNTYLQYHVYADDHNLYFKREEDIAIFLRLVKPHMDVHIVVTPERYEQMLEDKRSARSDGTY